MTGRMYRSALLVLPLILVACETTETTKPRHLSSTRGLQESSGGLGNKALVRTSDPSSLTRYRKVIVEDVKVSQSKSKDPKARTASRSDAERLAERFEEILREELRPHYQITNRRGRDTLAVRATLTDIQASRPEVFVFNYLPYAAALTTGVTVATGKTPGAGSTTVEAEVVDSYSRRQVFAIVDQYKGSKFQPGSLDRWGQTESSMRAWSRKIRAGIQGATPKPESPAASKSRTAAPKPVEKKKPETHSKEKSSMSKKSGASDGKEKTKLGAWLASKKKES